ncbi:hypothetical protein ACFUJR_26735 [Streptomyces sp. NPDC057271]|uniref:hypothetical protein n=1 Tax=unclassified Streptomyces TaxID=2593676 RepID=UPI00362BBF16
MDERRELTEDAVHDLLDGDGRDAGEDDEYEWVRWTSQAPAVRPSLSPPGRLARTGPVRGAGLPGSGEIPGRAYRSRV